MSDNVYRDVDRAMVFQVTAKLQAERALADDLAAALASLLEPGEEPTVLARYREARGR